MAKDENMPARDALPGNAGGKHGVVETYAEAMAKVIEDDKSGLVKKIIQEEEAHEMQKRNLSPKSAKNKFFLFFSLSLIFIASAVLLLFIFSRDNPTVSIEQQFTPLIFNDQNAFLEVKDLSKDQIAQTVLNEVARTSVKNGGIEGIYLTENKKVIGLRKFVALLEAQFSLDKNNFIDDNFLLGVARGSKENNLKDFFILLKIRTLSDVFDSLRAWERTMFSDLHGFLGMDISGETKYLLLKDFEDGLVENKNARILFGEDNQIVMMYIFAGDHSVIITKSANAAREIMLRLASSQIEK